MWEPSVGQRVRVRLNGECHYPAGTLWPGSPPKLKHPDEINGAIGVVDRIEETVLLLGDAHYWCVAFDPPIDCDGRLGPCHGNLLAAIELEPI